MPKHGQKIKNDYPDMDKAYIRAVREGEELWEWLADNPDKGKAEYPGKKYKTVYDCSICDYRQKKYDGLLHCSGTKSDKLNLDIPACILDNLCSTSFNHWKMSHNRQKHAAIIWETLFEERLRIMEYE